MSDSVTDSVKHGHKGVIGSVTVSRSRRWPGRRPGHLGKGRLVAAAGRRVISAIWVLASPNSHGTNGKPEFISVLKTWIPADQACF